LLLARFKKTFSARVVFTFMFKHEGLTRRATVCSGLQRRISSTGKWAHSADIPLAVDERRYRSVAEIQIGKRLVRFWPKVDVKTDLFRPRVLSAGAAPLQLTVS
jgi:hypothetical protein